MTIKYYRVQTCVHALSVSDMITNDLVFCLDPPWSQRGCRILLFYEIIYVQQENTKT